MHFTDELDQIHCTDVDEFVNVNKAIQYISSEDNEGYSMILCGNTLAHIAMDLQKASKKY